MQKRNEKGLDLLWGARAISQEIRQSERRTFYLLENGLIPAKRVGRKWVAHRSKLQEHFLSEEGEAA